MTDTKSSCYTVSVKAAVMRIISKLFKKKTLNLFQVDSDLIFSLSFSNRFEDGNSGSLETLVFDF
jgi:hypothetical protein